MNISYSQGKPTETRRKVMHNPWTSNALSLDK